MVALISMVYVVGWFLLCVSGTFTLVAMFRGKNTFVQIAGPFFILVGLPVFFSGNYLRTNVDSPSELLFWIPAILGAICGVFAGYGAK